MQETTLTNEILLPDLSFEIQDSFVMDQQSSNRFEDKSTGQYFVKNCPITAEEVVPYLVMDGQFPVQLAKQCGFKVGQMVRVYRPWDEIFKAKDSYAMKPIPVGHEDFHVSKLDSLPIGGYMGSSFDSKIIEGKKALLLDCHFVVPDVIAQVKDNSLKDFSVGYGVKYIYRPGVFKDYNGNEHAYDFIQTNIHCNHIALIPPKTARCDVAGVADQKFFINNPMGNNMSEINKANAEQSANADTTDAVTLSSLGKELEPKKNTQDSDPEAMVGDKDKEKKGKGDADDSEEIAKKKKLEEDSKKDKEDAKDQAIAELQKQVAEVNAKLAAQDAQIAKDSIEYQTKAGLYTELQRSSFACDSIEQAVSVADSLIDVLKSNGNVQTDTANWSVRDKQIFLAGYNAKHFKFDINKVKANDSVSTKEEVIDGQSMNFRNLED